MTNSKAQIVATIGPSSEKRDVLKAMLLHQADVIRINFSWADNETSKRQISLIRELEKECGKKIPIIQDLPGPRIQTGKEHTYDNGAASILTEEDKKSIQFGIEQRIDYIGLSFVGSAKDIEACREVLKEYSGKQKIIAKIERALAVENLAEIITAADAIMVARGDLGNEVPLERIPFVQDKIIRAAKAAGKPVIVATQMLLSMVNSPVPTRAEVTDVANAILEGSDAIMLSEETAIGTYPLEAVIMMEKIAVEAERNMGHNAQFNLL